MDDLQLHGLLGGGGGSNIKSIQRGSMSLSTGYFNLGISPIDLDSTIVLINNHAPFSSYTNQQLIFRAYLLDDSHLVFNKTNSSPNSIPVNYQIVEFTNVKSLQRGEATIYEGAESIIDIAQIDQSKSLLFYSFMSNDTGSGNRGALMGGRIKNNTQLAFNYGTSSANVSWQLIEFK